MKKTFGKKISIFAVVIVVSVVITLLLPYGLKYVYPLKYEPQITNYAEKYNLDKYLVMGIISAESGFKTDAKSNKDAFGLMQLKDDTALWCVENLDVDVNAENIRSPEANIQLGCAYMRYLIDYFDGNTYNAIAAYNAGMGSVQQWLSDRRFSDGYGKLTAIPYSETGAYVAKVQKRAKIYRKIYGSNTKSQ